MKIKTQLLGLITATIFIPIVTIVSLPIYNHYNSTKRFLFDGLKKTQSLGIIQLSNNQWNELRAQIARIPPEVQIMALYKQIVLFSNIKGFPSGSYCDYESLLNFLQQTNSNFKYQYYFINYESENQKIFEINKKNLSEKEKILVISQFSEKDLRKKPKLSIYVLFAIFICIEFFSITLLILFSKNIFNSIKLLGNSTKKIADGEFDTKIELKNKKTGINEITSLLENLEKMRQSLKESQEKKSKFIMGASHDLRTPIALIKGYSEAITDELITDPEEIKKSVSIIHSKSESLEELINDLINYVKLSNSDWIKLLKYHNAKNLFETYANSIAGISDVYNRFVQSEIKIDEDTEIQIDKKLLNSCLENLLSNALRYTNAGDTIYFKAIENETEGNIKLLVADTGCGIKPEDLKHIFDLLYRGTNSRREAGFGMGLSVVKSIVESMDWNIKVESELGKGTVFIITIPTKKKIL